MSRAKAPQPPAFAPMHADYDKSLTRVLVAGGTLADLAQTALDLGQVSETVRPRFVKAIKEYNDAFFGEGT